MNKLKKRILAIGVALMVALTSIPMLGSLAFADEAAATITVYLTVSDQGELAKANDGTVMGWKPVTVTDLDADGKFTFDEALVAAHKAYNTEAGYARYDSGWVTSLWGNSTAGVYSFAANNEMTDVVTATFVEDGDYLVAAIDCDAISYTDFYAFYDSNKVVLGAGEDVALTLKGRSVMFGGDADILPGLSVGYYTETGAYTDLNVKTDESGKATISFDEPGTYYVSAKGSLDRTVASWDFSESSYYPGVYMKTDWSTYEVSVPYTETDYGNGPYPVDEIKYMDYDVWDELTEAEQATYHVMKSNNVIVNAPITAPCLKVVVADEVIAIIHTNDVHGHIEIEPYVKGLADEMKAADKYSLVLTVSAGDVYTGGAAVAGYYNGELIPAIEDQVYDVIVPGNNDFPTGIPGNLLLSALFKSTKTICANIQARDIIDVAAYAATYEPKIGKADFAAMYDGVELKDDGSLDFSALNLGTIAKGDSPWQKTMVIETAKGTKLGLFGLTCTAGQMASMGDSAGTVVAAQESVASLKADGADVIVGIGHTGWMGEGSTDPAQTNDTNSWVVASETQDMDALIDSHTHSIINGGNGCYVGANRVLVNQAGCFGADIGIMYFYLIDGELVEKTAEVLDKEQIATITPDAAVQATVDAANERIHEVAGDPLVTTPYYLNGGTDINNPGGHVRGNETNMGDFVTDVLRAAASEKVGKDLAFSFIPGYCIRSSVDADVTFTKLEIASIFGMPLRLVAQDYTAEDIVALVTGGLTAVNPKFGAKFIQMSGINVVYKNNAGAGTPVTIKVGDTLIYDVNNGGIQVDADWSVTALNTIDPNSTWTGDDADLLCKSKEEVQELFHWYLETHEDEEGYTFFPNTIAPDNRIVEMADYSAVDAAKAQAAALDRNIYGDDDLKAVDDAVAAVVPGKPKTEQADVDAMATAINNAIAGLRAINLPYSGDRVFFVKDTLTDADEFGMWRVQDGSTVKLVGDNIVIHIIPNNTTTYGWIHGGLITDELTKDVALNANGTIDIEVPKEKAGYAYAIAPIKKSDGKTTSAQYYLTIPTLDKIAENEAAAVEVEEMIAALPAKHKLTVADKAKVDAALEAYEALSSGKKAAVDNYEQLKLAEATIDNLDKTAQIEDLEAQIAELQARIAELEAKLSRKEGWNKIEDKWYYCDANRDFVKGWVKDGSTWYFMDKETGEMKTGWLKDGESWYYLKSSGAMAASEWCEGYWLNANGTWTYQYKGSWKQDSTGWWFGDTSGWYAKSTTVKIDNVNYTFNASGYWVQ